MEGCENIHEGSEWRYIMKEDTIEIPKWIVERAIDALRQNYNCMNGESSIKRQTAQAHNYLSAYVAGKATEEEINSISMHYCLARLKHYE